LAESAGLRTPGRTAGDIALIYDGVLSALAMRVDTAPIERGRRLAEFVIERDLPERRNESSGTH
ncbi:hypothetical protein C6A85_61985, partial [Mycobacterium sp. ITM-2017-0098]